MSYWTEVDPPVSFIPEGKSYSWKRGFRYKMLDYLDNAARFEEWEGKRVLCVGDGGGIDAIEFAREGAIVNVIDMSEKAIALTKKHAEEAGVKITADVEDVCKMHFDGHLFDLVYSFGVIHHIKSVEVAVSEIYSVLKPGGTFMGMVYNKDSLMYAYSILLRAQKEGITPDEAMRQYSERNPGCPHSVAYTTSELLDVLHLFPHCTIEPHYDVIDLPNERKVRFELQRDTRLGWHLFFKAVK